jgi:hypothetical protein
MVEDAHIGVEVRSFDVDVAAKNSLKERRIVGSLKLLPGKVGGRL